MKKFIKYILLFSLPVVLFLLLAEWYCQTQTTFVVKKKYLENNINTIETLILGSSHSQNGINPEYFKSNSCNLAFGGQPISIDYFLLTKYLNRMKNLKTVVFEISPHRFYNEFNTQDWNGHVYANLYGIYYKNESFSVKNYSFVLSDVKYFSTIFLDNFNPTIHKPKLNKYGFMVNDFHDRFSKLNNDTLKIRKTFKMNHKFENQKNFKLNASFLAKISKECSDKKVKLVFITTPFYDTYASHIPLEASRQVQKLVNSISHNNNIPYFDFSKSKRFTLRDFKNDNHLNPNGAQKFSLIMDSLLTTYSKKHND
jgi:hypothetical protein